jgi:D-tyrosyl-tRNA(Tyr) deacylase
MHRVYIYPEMTFDPVSFTVHPSGNWQKKAHYGGYMSDILK